MPIAAIPALPPLPPVQPATPTGAAAPTDTSFGSIIANAVDNLQSAQTTASSDEAAAAAGQGNLADTMIAASEASLDTQVTTSLLDKAVTSYNDIMNMSF
jgi:flagellar hook-basal body complex protein FliE